MATNFGFMPVLTGKRYFISYKSEDSERVGEITRRLNKMGVPMWYDYGIEKGELWEQEINRNIKDSEAVIFFATKTLFAAHDTWVRIEFDIAKMYGKKRYVVWLDELDPYTHPEDVHDDLKIWYWNVARLQGIQVAGQSLDEMTQTIVTEFHLIKGKDPQPPSPGFEQAEPTPIVVPPVTQTTPPPAYAPQPRPASVYPSQPPSPGFKQAEPNPIVVPLVTQTTPPPAYAPQPRPASVYPSRPQAAPVFRDSAPSVRHTPLIVTVAIVLLVAIVSGIWAVSSSRKSTDSPTDYLISDLASASTEDSTDESISSSTSESTLELGNISVGEHFTFGSYPQGTDGEVQPIEWRVLAVQDGRALVISEKLLDCVPYNQEYTSVTWGTCTLHNWMKETFYEQAFTSEERSKIATVTNTNPDNDTQDNIFALSIDEAEKYFQDNDDRMAALTAYAIKNGAFTSDDYSLPTGENTGWWWLRSPGGNRYSAADVYVDGYGNLCGGAVNRDDIAVRPAFWLNL